MKTIALIGASGRSVRALHGLAVEQDGCAIFAYDRKSGIYWRRVKCKNES